MADLNSDTKNANPGKIRSRKLNSKVDLTAMVDLAFLLITFFMLTTSLTKPHAMDLTLPDDSPVKPMPVDENLTMTILIGKDNKLKCYMGMLSENRPKEIAFSDSKALRKEIVSNKKKASVYANSIGKPEKSLIVLIKPGNKSNYRNLVDVLDEMAISNIQTYAITDLAPAESRLLTMR